MITALLHGIILSFGLILPLGAQNIFIFNQGASHRSLWYALPAILTASLCDTILILLAVFGVSLAILTFTWLKTGLFAVGLIFLLYMGWVVWNSQPAPASGDRQALSARRQIMFASSVSLLNPHAILDTIGVIGTSSLAYAGAMRWTFVIACIAVSWLWFFGLAVAGRIVGKLDQTGRLMLAINRISALLIWAVALYIARQLLLQ